MPKHPQYYADQCEWRVQQQFLPLRMRLTDDQAPLEEFWTWRGHHVHLDRYLDAHAPAKLVLHHGVGTNGRQMSLLLGAPMAAAGYETVALDNLGYGMTAVRPRSVPTYADWVDLVVDFLVHEKSRDDRPIVIFGLSAGGMLAYHVAAKAPRGTLDGIVGMTFLDQRLRSVRDETAHGWFTARIGVPVVDAVASTALGRVRYPMTWASRMRALVNNPDALRVFLRDRSSAGSWVSLRFLSSYLNYVPAVEPEHFDACPVLLTQPGRDRWSPLNLSMPVLSRMNGVPVHISHLANAGHYPLEEPGVSELATLVADFIATTTDRDLPEP